MARIMLPIENKVRELIGKLWLSFNLTRSGHRVALGYKSAIYGSFDITKPEVYFTLSAVNGSGRLERLRKLRDFGTTIVALDTEGSAFPGVEKFKRRLDPAVLEFIDIYFAWGEAPANILREQRTYTGDLVVTGNPRFDVLQEGLRAVYAEPAERIRLALGDYILFNTNFAINHVDAEYAEQWSKGVVQDSRDIAKTETRILGEFISFIAEIAEEFDEYSVVVRPHPAERQQTCEWIFRPYENILVRREGDVRPWILGSDCVVHNSCTTGVSAALLGEPVFAYAPGDITYHSSPIPNIVSDEVQLTEDLIQNITALEAGQEYMMSSDQLGQLQKHIANTDFFAAKRIREAIDGATLSQIGGPEFRPDHEQKVKRLLLRTVGQNALNEYYYGGSERKYNHKFRPLNSNELEELVSQFPEAAIPNDLKIENIKRVEDTCWVYVKTTRR